MIAAEKIHKIEIKIASPDIIRELSGGEVLNYKTYTLDSSGKQTIPAEVGLFDPKIFRKYKECSAFKFTDNEFIIKSNIAQTCSKYVV